MFGADAGVIQAGGDAFGLMNLAVFILKEVGSGPVKDSDSAHAQGGTMMAGRNSFAASFNSD